jgi:hypothetical protein
MDEKNRIGTSFALLLKRHSFAFLWLEDESRSLKIKHYLGCGEIRETFWWWFFFRVSWKTLSSSIFVWRQGSSLEASIDGLFVLWIISLLSFGSFLLGISGIKEPSEKTCWSVHCPSRSWENSCCSCHVSPLRSVSFFKPCFQQWLLNRLSVVPTKEHFLAQLLLRLFYTEGMLQESAENVCVSFRIQPLRKTLGVRFCTFFKWILCWLSMTTAFWGTSIDTWRKHCSICLPFSSRIKRGCVKGMQTRFIDCQNHEHDFNPFHS